MHQLGLIGQFFLETPSDSKSRLLVTHDEILLMFNSPLPVTCDWTYGWNGTVVPLYTTKTLYTSSGQQIAMQGISFNHSQISKNRNQEFRKSLRRLAICAFSSWNIIVNSISLNISGLQSRGIFENIVITLSAHSRRICPRPWHQLMFNWFENGSTKFTDGWRLARQAKMQRMHSFR